MYTFLMMGDKSLVATIKTTLYQREKLVDKIQFLIPQTYGDMDLSDWTVTLKYLDQVNTAHSEILTKDPELYKEHLKYVLPVDTKLTQYAGDIKVRLTLSKVDMEVRTQYVLHSGEATVTIAPLSDYYKFVSDESLEFVDQLVGNLEAKLEAAEKLAEMYDKEKADNLVYEDNELQLTSNGEKIGDAVTIKTIEGGGSEEELDVVEF